MCVRCIVMYGYNDKIKCGLIFTFLNVLFFRLAL